MNVSTLIFVGKTRINVITNRIPQEILKSVNNCSFYSGARKKERRSEKYAFKVSLARLCKYVREFYYVYK